MTPGELAAIRRRAHQTMPEPEATRWRYETIVALCDECERLTAENARLREALDPFATEYEKNFDGPWPDTWHIDGTGNINVGHFRAARATLADTERSARHE